MATNQPIVGVATFSLPRERTDLAERFQMEAVEGLKGLGLEVVSSEELVFSEADAVKTARTLASQKADCILYLMGTWVFCPAVVSALESVSLPSGIWANADPASFSLTAGGMVHGSLDELGVVHRFIYGPPGEARTLDRVATFARAARVVTRLRGTRLALIGGRVMGMYTTQVDTAQIKDAFGVELEHIDSLCQYLEAEQADPGAVARERATLQGRFGAIAVDDERLDRSIRVYLALRKIIHDGGYDFAAVKCQGAMIDTYACSCLAVSLINDEGMVLACESDVNAALTMQMLKLASGASPIVFGDINHVDCQRKVLRIVNCGSMPSLLAPAPEEVELQSQYEYLGKAGGATVVLCCKAGPVTLARLSRIKGQYVMLIAQGNAVERPKEQFREARDRWPHLFVELDGDPELLLQNVRSNHLHACYGHWTQELEVVCDLLRIKPIIIRS